MLQLRSGTRHGTKSSKSTDENIDTAMEENIFNTNSNIKVTIATVTRVTMMILIKY